MADDRESIVPTDSGETISSSEWRGRWNGHRSSHESEDDDHGAKPTNRPHHNNNYARPTGRPNGRTTVRPNNNSRSRPTNTPHRPGWVNSMQETMQNAKEKARQKAKPTTSSPRSRNGKPGWMNPMKSGMPTRAPSHTSKPMHAQAMKAKNSMFPVLVGMLFRNHSAVKSRDMNAFFQQIMSPEVMKWKEQMENKQLNEEYVDEGTHMLNKHATMEKMHGKMMRHVGEMDMNVFHFQPLHTDDSMFQVSHCYAPEQTSHGLLHVHTSFKDNVQKNIGPFSIAMRKAIAEAMGVSYLQIGNLKPEPHVDVEKNIDGTYVAFQLLGTPPVRPTKIKQPSINQAKKMLITAINNGISFKVNYATHTKSFMVDKNFYSLDRRMFQKLPSQNKVSSLKNTDSSDDNSAYSSASVAGIAIATLVLGVVLAVAAIILLHKRKHPEEPVIPYKITKN